MPILLARVIDEGCLIAPVLVFLATITASSLGCSHWQPPELISAQPAAQIVYELQVATFRVTANAGATVKYQWQRNGNDIPGATSSVYTTPRTTIADNGMEFRAVVSTPHASETSNSATLTVNQGIDVPTYQYDNMRTGRDASEMVLTPTSISQSGFGKITSFVVDGRVDAQPLYMSNISIAGVGPRNVLYVATEHGTVFAFDADATGAQGQTPLWTTSTLLPGESASDDHACGQITPEIGITATPVIDRSRGAIYVVAMSKNANANYFHRLHALDLSTGKELFNGPVMIAATYPGTGEDSSNGVTTFVASQYKERAGLVAVNGQILTTWAAHCDYPPYGSWVISYKADDLQQTGVLNLTANGSRGGIWMAGGAPAVDASGNVYLISGNGDFDPTLDTDGHPSSASYGNCFLKLSSDPPLKVLDYFTPADTRFLSDQDIDLGSGGAMLLPDLVDSQGRPRHLAIGAGKDLNIYVVDRDDMGKFQSGGDKIYQEVGGSLGGGVFSNPAFWDGAIYYGAAGDSIKSFSVAKASLQPTPLSMTSNKFNYPGATPTISASGTSNGILWAVENDSAAGVLHAYDAHDLTQELYNSNRALNRRDKFPDNKYVLPLVANGKVYVGTPDSVAVFGLLVE